MAEFHEEMLSLGEKKGRNLTVVTAFRGAGKSTILNLSLSLWSIIGERQKKLVIIISQKLTQAKSHLDNIRQELLNNELLNNDFPGVRIRNNMNSSIIDIDGYKTRIIAVPSLKSLRGLKNFSKRPDLIICDDLEDMASTAIKKQRKSLFEWFANEVLPLGDNDTNIIVLGSPLHIDSLITRLRDLIDEGKIQGEHRAYPLLDSNGKNLWPGKFKSDEDIVKLKSSLSDEDVWAAEYQLDDTRGITMGKILDHLNEEQGLDKKT